MKISHNEEDRVTDRWKKGRDGIIIRIPFRIFLSIPFFQVKILFLLLDKNHEMK